MDNLLLPAQIKSRELEILEFVDAFCKKHGITYFLSYGSLLGAVRHKGFIPWDDDIDISMLRPDYERFKCLIAQEESKRFKAMIPKRKDYPYNFIKIVDSMTSLIEENLDYSEDMGVWIDVFPLDGCSTSGCSLTERLASFSQKCRALASYKVLPENKHGNRIVWYLCRMVGYNAFKELTDYFSRRISVDDSPLVAHVPTANQTRFPRILFDKVTEVEFEGRRFPAPMDYHQYLTIHYGDYMKLPPENERVNHSVKAIIKEL
jgi:lipopolysaccharide cholinephosphotransferase